LDEEQKEVVTPSMNNIMIFETQLL